MKYTTNKNIYYEYEEGLTSFIQCTLNSEKFSDSMSYVRRVVQYLNELASSERLCFLLLLFQQK